MTNRCINCGKLFEGRGTICPSCFHKLGFDTDEEFSEEQEKVFSELTERRYPIYRDSWEALFKEFLNDCGFNDLGNPVDEKLNEYVSVPKEAEISDDEFDDEVENIPIFDNGVFRIIPFCWESSEGLFELPNFTYYPTKYQIEWYKYPFRDAWANKDIDMIEFVDILRSCKRSLDFKKED